MLFVFTQGGGKVIQRNAFKILVFGRTILRDKQVGVINGTAGIAFLTSIWSAPDAAKSASIRASTSSSASPKMPLRVKVISLAFSIIAVSLFKIGISGSDGEKALVSPPKIRPGSMRTNNTGSISREMTATMIFRYASGLPTLRLQLHRKDRLRQRLWQRRK